MNPDSNVYEFKQNNKDTYTIHKNDVNVYQNKHYFTHAYFDKYKDSYSNNVSVIRVFIQVDNIGIQHSCCTVNSSALLIPFDWLNVVVLIDFDTSI